MTASYASLALVKGQLGIAMSDTQDDALINQALATTTDKINEKTGQLGTGFNRDTVASPRFFHATHPELLTVDAIVDPSLGIAVAIGNAGAAAATYTTVVDPSAYQALPLNNVVRGRPVDTLRNVYAVWPTQSYIDLMVTTFWGWPAVPNPVIQAQLLWLARLFRRKDSQDGIAGQGGYGPIRVGKMDPDVEEMLAGYGRGGFA